MTSEGCSNGLPALRVRNTNSVVIMTGDNPISVWRERNGLYWFIIWSVNRLAICPIPAMNDIPGRHDLCSIGRNCDIECPCVAHVFQRKSNQMLKVRELDALAQHSNAGCCYFVVKQMRGPKL